MILYQEASANDQKGKKGNLTKQKVCAWPLFARVVVVKKS
jgi:hypothetical protein